MDFIDKIIMEFFPNKKVSAFHRKIIVWVLGLDKFLSYVRNISNRRGIEWLNALAEKINITFKINDEGYNNIPKQGPVIIVSNHPTVMDGMALIIAVSKVRHDIKIVANHVLTLMFPKVKDITIGIRNMQDKLGSTQFKEMNAHLKKGGVLIICPAGRLASLQATGLKESPWHTGFLHLARKNNVSLVPIAIKGSNSAIYYIAAKIWRPLSNLMLARECLRHRGSKLQLTILPQVNTLKLDFSKDNINQVAASFQEHVERINRNQPGILPVIAPIAQPEDRISLIAALDKCEVLKKLSDGKTVLLYHPQGGRDSPVIRELGRLRETVFREIGAGTGHAYDNDEYDKYYHHIIIWDPVQLEIAGAYRFLLAGEYVEKYGLESLYSHSLFKYKSEFLPVAAKCIEIGRGFIQKQFQKTNVLDELWKGIFNVALKNGQYKYLLGVLTIPKYYSTCAKNLIVEFSQVYLPANEKPCSPDSIYRISGEEITGFFNGESFSDDWSKLKIKLRELGYELPWPYKQAVKWYCAGGSKILCFVEDEHFNSVAGLNLCEIDKLKENYGKRYLPGN
jgi:putative hemolysin